MKPPTTLLDDAAISFRTDRDDSPAAVFTRLAEAAQSEELSTPCYLMDHASFHRNGRILKRVQDETGAKILLAQKAFSCFNLYPTLRNYLAGTTASGIHEARLGAEEFGGETHVFSPAYKDSDMAELVKVSDHIVFNSLSQWARHRNTVLDAPRHISAGLRVNPLYSESCADIYDPCRPGSRFGVLLETLKEATPEELDGIEGIHFHTLCEQNSDALERTLERVLADFGPWLKKMKWLNMGGGHLITNESYDVNRLIAVLRRVKRIHPHLTLYLEPGEAICAGTGVLVGEVVDLVRNGMDIAILDVSATTHMPDVLEMPYRADVEGSGQPGEKAHDYRLGAPTCLSGDHIGDYSFDERLEIGDRVVFHDMSHYTMVKNTTFNGIPLPAIAILQENGEIETIRTFGYEDFRNRLA